MKAAPTALLRHAATPIHDFRLRPLAIHPVARRKHIQWRDLGREPFRLFFPAAVLAGVLGVSLWPLYFTHLTDMYPGVGHARIMAFGFFGGFILGFLGTAMPRMLSARPLRLAEVLPLVSLHLVMAACFASGHAPAGNVLFLSMLTLFAGCMVARFGERKDLPPPGFVLVALSLGCAAVGSMLGLMEDYTELDPFWIALGRLLAYQGFVLLPILGIGPFLLPRFLGMSTPEFPEFRQPNAAWVRKATIALGAGLFIVSSFVLEAKGWFRTAYGIRFATTLAFYVLEMPFHRAPKKGNALGAAVRIALAGIVAGFLAVALFPAYRVALLHLTLIGGFAVITLTVATRVVFGHSGNSALLKKRNRWLLVTIGLMLFAMATRISGDFWPKIMASHYIYGAVLWIVSVLAWAFYVLPKVRLADED